MSNDIPHLDLECSNASIRLVGQTRNRPAETGKKKNRRKGLLVRRRVVSPIIAVRIVLLLVIGLNLFFYASTHFSYFFKPQNLRS